MIGGEGHCLHRSLSKLMEHGTSSPCSLLFSYLCPRRKPSEHKRVWKGCREAMMLLWSWRLWGGSDNFGSSCWTGEKENVILMPEELVSYPRAIKEASRGELGLRVTTTISARWRRQCNDGNNGNRSIIYVHNVIVHNQRRQWHPTPVLLPGKSHRWRSLRGRSPWGREESDTTERPHFHFSLSCIGEGNGHPLQCSCLENARDRGDWWAAIYGVAQSQTRLKRLSSSRIVYNGIPWWLSSKKICHNVGDTGLIPGSGRSSGEEMTIHCNIFAWEIP